MWNPFKRKNFASPYYGKGNKALFTAPPMIPQQQEEAKTSAAAHSHSITTGTPAEPDWELRRFELVKMLVAQERRSVVLGKLMANDKQIVAKARSIADAAIKELQTHPFKSYEEVDRGAEADDQQRCS